MTELFLDGVLADVGNKNDKYEKFPPTKLAWDIKGAGVASTVVQNQIDKCQVQDALQREQSNNIVGLPDPFGESLRGKRKLLHHSQLSKNSKALDRLKEKIQRQKDRSPVAADKFSHQQRIQASSASFLEDTELCTRKITKGPSAPKYKGFNSAITRIKTVSSQPSRQTTPSDLYISRTRNESRVSDIRISGVEAPPKRTKVTARDGSSLERKTMITPSSWRQGQHIAETILGPPVKHPKQPRKQDVSAPKVETKEANVRKPRQSYRHDVSVPQAQGDDSNVAARPVSAPPLTRSVVKHKRPELDMEPEKEKQPKVRHYDQNAVQQYIVKKKEERKRKKSQERKAYKEAQAKKQKQLEELYRRQKKYAVPKKKPLVEDENCPPDDATLTTQPMKPTIQSRDNAGGNAGVEESNSLARFDQRASEIMERLTSFGPRSTMVKPFFGNEESHLGSKSVSMKLTPSVNDESQDSASPNLAKESAPSEFMRKLDQYLDDNRSGFDGFGKQTSSRSAHLYSECPDLSRNEFDSSVPRMTAYSTNAWDNSPSASWSKKTGIDRSPSNEYLSAVRMRAERIAALKSRADTLNEKMEITLKLVEQPIIPSTHNVDDVDKILRKDFAVSSSASLPNVDEILRKYDVETNLPSLPGANLRSNWPVPVRDPPEDPVTSSMKHMTPIRELENASREDPVLESSFSSRLKSSENASDPVSSHTLGHDSDNDEIPDQCELVDEYHVHSHHADRFDADGEDSDKIGNRSFRSPTMKSKVTKAPWETLVVGDKHSIINLCVGRIMKDKESKHRMERPIDVPESRGVKNRKIFMDDFQMETENSFTSSISKDISPTSTPKNIMPKICVDDVLGNATKPSLTRSQLPQIISPKAPVKHLLDEFDVGLAPHHTDVGDQETVKATEETRSAERAPTEDDASTFAKITKPTTQHTTDYTPKFSPAALEQKLLAELNYQDSIDETLRHLTGVEKTQSTSAAQQDSVSLAQLVKTQQLIHGFELEKGRIEALSRIRQQAPTDQRKAASPQSVSSRSRTTDSTNSPNEKDFGSRKNVKSTTYKDDHFSSSSSPSNSTEYHPPSDSVESVPEDLPKLNKDEAASRKEMFSEKYASDESEWRSSYDKKRPARKFGHTYQTEKLSKHKNEMASLSTDLTSDSSATSVHFDESLTEDEIAEISLRAVVASEGHRRRHRSRSNVPLKKFEGGYENLKASHAMERGNEKNSEFFQFMDELVQRYMQEEEFRSHHQEAMLHLRKRAIKEKTEAELAMLKKMKKQARKKGEDEKMPPLEKKQRAILRRYKMENAEIKKLKAMAKVADQDRKYFIQQNASRRPKRDDYGDIEADVSDTVKKESKEKLDATSPGAADHDNSSIPDSISDISTSSSVLMKKIKSNIKALDEQKLTKREQLLMKRKKQAEQLIAWKKRLDREEQQVCNIEKKALRTWDKDLPNKQGKKKSQEKDSDQEASSDSNGNTATSLTESSIAEEIASATADSSASQSVVSPSLPSRGEVRQRSSSSETIQEDDSQYSDFPLETQDVTKPKLDANEKSPSDSKTKTTSRSEQPVDQKPTADSEPPVAGRKDSLETWSDESISQTPSETEQSDIECRVRALREELNRRRLIAERLKKKQKQRHKDRLKAQEASLRSQIEAYDIFIRKTQDELNQELGSQPSGVVAKPQIRSPQKNHQGRQQLLHSSLGSSETSTLSGHVSLAGGAYQRSESESSDKSRTNEDEDMPNDGSPGGSMKSGIHEKPESAIPKFNKQMTTGGISRSLFSTGTKPKSLIPVPSRNSTTPKLSSTTPPQLKDQPQESAVAKKSLDADITSPTALERKLSESEDDISEHIDEISNVSSEKHSSVDQLPLLDLNVAKALSSVEETAVSDRKKETLDKKETLVTSPVTSLLEFKPKEDLHTFKIGDRVVVAGRDTGLVRFIGETSFAKGTWVGVELQSTIGKNDGSVSGIRYFTCSPNHGIFAPPAKITLVSEISGSIPVTLKKDSALDFVKPTDEESGSESSSSISSQKETSRENIPSMEPTIKASETKENNMKLADRLTSGLLDSLLEDSMDHILHQYSESKSRDGVEQEERDETGPVDLEDKPDVDVKKRSSLAESFSDDLFRDTVEKVIEIRKQRAKKWSSQDVHEDYDNVRSPLDGKADYGKEVEDILGMKGSRMMDVDSDTDDKDSAGMTPVRPVSPVLGGQDEWIEDDLSACLAKPLIASQSTDNEIWKDGQFIEALSDFFEPSPIPKEFAVDHDPDQILKLVENTVSAFYSRHAKGDDIDTFVPDVIFDETSKKAEDDVTKTIDVTVRKKQDVDANHVFKMSLIDMVREFMMEVFAYKSLMEARSTTPKWQKKRVSSGPMYKKIPNTEEELQMYVSKKVSKLLNLHGSMDKRNRRIGMKWGSQKKKDKVDIILVRELREEEPEWTNYDEDETTVKMQLTDTILDLLLSDSIHCLNEIHSKKIQSFQKQIV